MVRRRLDWCGGGVNGATEAGMVRRRGDWCGGGVRWLERCYGGMFVRKMGIFPDKKLSGKKNVLDTPQFPDKTGGRARADFRSF